MDISLSTPLFKKDALVSYREEKDGFISISPADRLNIERKLLNRTSSEIINTIDGTKTVSDITSHMISLYPFAPQETIENDIVIALFNMWKSGIITWKKGENPFMSEFVIEINPNERIRLAFEEDTRSIIEFNSIPKSNADYQSPVARVDPNESLFIRHSMFSLNHLFFLYEKDEKIESVVIISIDWLLPVANIISMQNVGDSFIEYFPKIVEILKMFGTKKFNKIRAFVTPEDREVSFRLTKSGFRSIVVLEREIEDNDVEILDFFINERGRHSD